MRIIGVVAVCALCILPNAAGLFSFGTKQGLKTGLAETQHAFHDDCDKIQAENKALKQQVAGLQAELAELKGGGGGGGGGGGVTKVTQSTFCSGDTYDQDVMWPHRTNSKKRAQVEGWQGKKKTLPYPPKFFCSHIPDNIEPQKESKKLTVDDVVIGIFSGDKVVSSSLPSLPSPSPRVSSSGRSRWPSVEAWG
jgi:hypothetical protein